jgi:2-amino-4-hydroxy-6-hydroxymethyldihydropteridine diphosphokinase
MSESTVYIAIGSNLGERRANCKKAVQLLASVGEVLSVSPLYDTAPWGVTKQPRFLNGAVLLSTTLSPVGLLAELKSIESKMGRVKASEERYGPRIIDLDIIFFDDIVKDVEAEEGLVLPHPRMHERAFVLKPLADIAPEVIHPKLKKSVRELLAALPAEDRENIKNKVS